MVPEPEWQDRVPAPDKKAQIGEDKEKESDDSKEKERRIKDIERFRQLLKDKKWTKARRELLGE